MDHIFEQRKVSTIIFVLSRVEVKEERKKKFHCTEFSESVHGAAKFRLLIPANRNGIFFSLFFFYK